MKSFKAYGKQLSCALAVVMLAGLLACTSTPTPTPTPQPVLPGIGYFSASLLDLDDATAGVDVEIYIRALNLNTAYVPENPPTTIYYYDVTPPTEQGKPATTSAGTYIEVPRGDDIPATWKNTPSGMRTFSAQIVNNNYTPLDPPVVAQSTILVPAEISQKTPALQSMTVQSSPPVPVGYGPSTSPSTPSTNFEAVVSASIYNFKLNDDNIGKANVPGEGHYIYYMDAAPPTTQGEPALTAPGSYRITASHALTWTQVPVGNHTFAIQLVNNDNTPLNPPVIMELAITMPAEPS
jgi:hypothetical protein